MSSYELVWKGKLNEELSDVGIVTVGERIQWREQMKLCQQSHTGSLLQVSFWVSQEGGIPKTFDFDDLVKEYFALSKGVEFLEKRMGTEKIYVPDFDLDLVEKHKTQIMKLVENGDEIDPFTYAEKENIYISFALLCFDELITEGEKD